VFITLALFFLESVGIRNSVNPQIANNLFVPPYSLKPIKHSRKKERASFGADRPSWAKDFFIGIIFFQNRKDQDREMTLTGAP
jgi:hypothetical protein